MELSATTVVEYHGNYCHKGQHTRCHRRFTARNNKIKTQIMSLGPYQGQLKTSARSKMKLHVSRDSYQDLNCWMLPQRKRPSCCRSSRSCLTFMELLVTTLNSIQLPAIVATNSITDVAEASLLETPLNRLSGRTCHQTSYQMQIYKPCNIQIKQ